VGLTEVLAPLDPEGSVGDGVAALAAADLALAGLAAQAAAAAVGGRVPGPAGAPLRALPPDGAGPLAATLRALVERTAPQSARFACSCYRSACSALTELGLGAGPAGARRALPALLGGLRRVQPSPEVLTPQHGMALELALASRCLGEARELVAAPVLDVRAPLTGVTAPDVLAYGLHGAGVCLALRDYQRALDLLLLAISVPAVSPPAASLAAYKRYVLASLVARGEVPPLPHYVPPATARACQRDAGAYADLAGAFRGGDPAALERVASENRAALTADGNWELAGEVARALETARVRRLTETYLTLPLTDVAAKLGAGDAGEAEARVVALVRRGHVAARVDRRSRTVEFRDAEEVPRGAALLAELEGRLEGAVDAASRVAIMDAEVQLSDAYVERLASRDRAGRGRAGLPGAAGAEAERPGPGAWAGLAGAGGSGGAGPLP